MPLGRPWCRRVWQAAGLVFVAALAPAVVAPPAEANVCMPNPPYDRCYAITDWTPAFPSPYTGAIAYIKTSQLVTPSPNTDFATSELWVCTQITPCAQWVESGVIHGVSPVDPDPPLSWFWAEQNRIGQFIEHYAGLPGFSFGTTYAVKISYNGGDKFAVYRDGAFLANSTPQQPLPASVLQAGTENTRDGNLVSGSASCLQKRHSDNTSWSYLWSGATILETNPPLTSAGWIEQYKSLWFKMGNAAQTSAGCGGPPTSISDFTFPAVADTYVDQSDPGSNFGSSTELRVNSELPQSGDFRLDSIQIRNALLKFDTSGFSSYHPVESVRVEVCALNSSAAGGDFSLTQNTSWDENSVDWGSAPGPTGQSVSLGLVVAGTCYEVNVTDIVPPTFWWQSFERDPYISFRVSSKIPIEVKYASKEMGLALRAKLKVDVQPMPQ